MPTEPAPLTVAEAVNRAVEACDPEGRSASAADVLDRLGDDERPIASLADPDEELAEAFGALDPEAEDPVVQMIRAVTTYLAFRRDEAADTDTDLLRLAARAEFDGKPPEPMRGWLAERGVEA